MKLQTDEKNQIFVWIDENNAVLSPHFDYEEDAIQWYNNMKKEFENVPTPKMKWAWYES